MSETREYLNFGCGHSRINGFCNVDVNPEVNPDLVVNMRVTPFPFESNSALQIVCYHTIEHIEHVYHFHILQEFWRILKPGGVLIISYPEFLKCAENYKTNFQGRREFWAATIFGRQARPDDYHVSLMDSQFFSPFLESVGFTSVTTIPEHDQPFNTILTAIKGNRLPSYEEKLKMEFFD